jgi:ethanolaminephosphotransferase
MVLHLKNYITPDGEQAIRNFKYKGSSSAFSYDYLWSPFAEYMLKYIPITWAPNAITLVGFILVLVGAFSIYFIGDLGDPVTSFQEVFFAICIFTYQTLDNIDGKQARRTGTSTPLGMLFDHGCDSMSCFLLSISLSRVFMITDEKLLLFGIFLGVQLIFYMSVWTQYHSNGIMHLGNNDLT